MQIHFDLLMGTMNINSHLFIIFQPFSGLQKMDIHCNLCTPAVFPYILACQNPVGQAILLLLYGHSIKPMKRFKNYCERHE